MNSLFTVLHGLLIPFGIILGSIIVGLLLRGIVGWWVKRVINSLGWSRARQFSVIIRHPFLYWSILLGISIAIRYIAVIPWLVPYIVPCLWGGFIILLSQTVSRIATQVILIRADKAHHAPSSTLILKITQSSIYLIAVVLILNSFGVNIAAIIAALGIGGLALALALQDTLSNIFAGVYITLAGQISVGNFIRISDAKFVEPAEGFVVDISWRTTILKRLDGNLVVLPNNVLSQATVVNYTLPDVLCRVSMKVSVDTSSDTALVQTILNDVITQQATVSAVQIHLFEIQETGIDFMVYFLVNNPDLQFSIRSEIVKTIMHRLSAEYILLKSILNTNGTLLHQFAFVQQSPLPPIAAE